MRVINRTAVTITGAKPYIDWTLRTDADVNKGAIPVARPRTYGSAFLLPEFELEEDVQEWVEDNAAWIFEFQLGAWTDDETTVPQGRDLASFRPRSNTEITTVGVDVADAAIEGEEL